MEPAERRRAGLGRELPAVFGALGRPGHEPAALRTATIRLRQPGQPGQPSVLQRAGLQHAGLQRRAAPGLRAAAGLGTAAGLRLPPAGLPVTAARLSTTTSGVL